MKTTPMFNLLDYKGKFTIIQDKNLTDAFDVIVGTIDLNTAVEEAEWRKENSLYYGIPAYVGKHVLLNRIYNA